MCQGGIYMRKIRIGEPLKAGMKAILIDADFSIGIYVENIRQSFRELLNYRMTQREVI